MRVQQLDMDFGRNYQVVVQRADEKDAPRHAGYLYGTVHRDRLIAGGFGLTSFETGDRLRVRMALGGQEVGFATCIMEVCEDYQPLYFLAYPDHVERLTLRRADRLNVLVPAEVQQEAANTADYQPIQGVMLNISRGGCCISSKTPLQHHSGILLSFTLPGADRKHQLEGRVVRNFDATRVYLQGVQFGSNGQHNPALSDVEQWVNTNLAYALPA